MPTRRDVLASGGAMLGLVGAASPVLGASPPRMFEIPVDLEFRRLVVSCTINGQGPFHFGIDTGGFMSVLRLDLAKQLKLQQRGSVRSEIAGQLDFFPIFQADELVFGNVLRQRNVVLAGVDRITFGGDVLGMLAAGCMTTMDAELDFVAGRWRIFPDGGPARDGWVRHQRAIVLTGPTGSPHLFGTATLAGQQLHCLLDTGAPGAVVLSAAAARRTGIEWDRQNWSPKQVNGREARIFRSRNPLAIGGLTIDQPLITVQRDSPKFIDDGLIGLPVIERLDVATQVRPGFLWTRPNGRPPESQDYNRSGLWIDRRKDGLFAGFVGRGSPAENAGIAIGDQIEGSGFTPLIQALNGPAGSSTSLTVVGAAGRRNVRLDLRDYL